MKAYCDKCNKNQKYSITTKKTRLLKYMFKIARCDVCNEKIYIDEIIEENLKEFDDCMDNVEAINKKAEGRK